MPKNTKGGKGYKKGKKGGNGPVSKILILKEDGTEYATLKKNLGNSRFECDCHDGRTRIGHIRGKMQKRVWLATDNLVLVSIRDFQDDKCDIIHKYNEEDKSSLLSMGQLVKEKLVQSENGGNEEGEELGIEFSNEVDEQHDYGNLEGSDGEINFDEI